MYCLTIGGVQIDQAVSEALLAALQPAGLEAALRAAERIGAGHDSALEQWRLAVERARYEAERAERRFNQRLWQVEHRCSDGVWERFTPRSEAWLKERIAEDFDEAPNGPRAKGRLMFTGRRWDQALNALVAEREADPVVEWLEQLPPWDGMPRLDSWIGLCFRVDSGTPAALCAWAARSILLGAVWRAYRPGTKHDVLVVFVGPQGIGKSTSFAWLFPPSDRDAWFSDTLTLNGSGKERVEALQGRVLVECAEMAGSTQADLARLKAFLSRTDDGGIRLAYRRNPEPRPRRAVLVGSTNDFRCLPNDRAVLDDSFRSPSRPVMSNTCGRGSTNAGSNYGPKHSIGIARVRRLSCRTSWSRLRRLRPSGTATLTISSRTPSTLGWARPTRPSSSRSRTRRARPGWSTNTDACHVNWPGAYAPP